MNVECTEENISSGQFSLFKPNKPAYPIKSDSMLGVNKCLYGVFRILSIIWTKPCDVRFAIIFVFATDCSALRTTHYLFRVCTPYMLTVAIELYEKNKEQCRVYWKQ